MSDFGIGRAVFEKALLMEGLSLNSGISDILSLSKSSIHRISYAGMTSEVLGVLQNMDPLNDRVPMTLSGKVMQKLFDDSDLPRDLSTGWQAVETFFGRHMPSALRTSDMNRVRLQVYFDCLHEPDTKTQNALQIMRLLDLTNPVRGFAPDGKHARIVERLDPASIFAWYSRKITSPFHIEEGADKSTPITKGYVYVATDAVVPEQSRGDLRATTANILEEASNLRMNSIPNAAFVEIDIPPLVALCFAEISPELVLMEGIDPEGRSLPIVYQPSLGTYQGPNTGAGAGGKIENFEHYVDLVALLGASALRDFWVIEERERVLGVPRISRIRGLESKKSRVIYLPRIRYVGERLRKGGKDPLSASERRAHWRSAHFRALPKGKKPSKKQLLVAAANQQTPPPGTTWVRGATVGGKQEEIVYRSRSATKALFDTIPFEGQSHGNLSWFAFERMCAHALKRRGLEELTRIGGDRGADLYCSKSIGKQIETWVVQCKHWSRKVGPEVIRELHGARALRDADRALLVSSSAFTDGAIQTAHELGIDLVSASEFEKFNGD